MALVDSYTIGQSVAMKERWPVQLVLRLREEGFTIAEPEIIARTGWTTGELSLAIDQAAPQGPYELVTLMVGVNNQFRGREIEEYWEEFGALLQRAVGFAGGNPSRVIVLSIPDWGATPLGREETASKPRRRSTSSIPQIGAWLKRQVLDTLM